MSNNLPKVPVRLLEQNDELLKAQAGISGQSHEATDYSNTEVVGVISGPQATYRTPPDRMIGNVFFRRYINGALDLRYAVDKVVDALHRCKDGGGIDQLNNEEKTALGVLFPMQFATVDNSMIMQVASVQLKISLMEMDAIRQAVAAHVQEELNYNAGRGGSSAPGRHQTRS